MYFGHLFLCRLGQTPFNFLDIPNWQVPIRYCGQSSPTACSSVSSPAVSAATSGVGTGGALGAVGVVAEGSVVVVEADAAAAAAVLKLSTGDNLLLLNLGLSSPPCVVTGGL